MGESQARRKATSFSGSPAYMARGPLNRYTQVRKDDFISLGLVLLRLNGVYMPWMDKINDDDYFVDIMDTVLLEWVEYGTKVRNILKVTSFFMQTYYSFIVFQKIIDDSDSPRLFAQYFDYFDSIQSHEQPDYDWLVKLFTSELKNISKEGEPRCDQSESDDSLSTVEEM